MIKFGGCHSDSDWQGPPGPPGTPAQEIHDESRAGGWMPARTVVLTMLPPGGPRPGRRPLTVADSDYASGRKLGFKFRDTVTVAARFKFKVRGLGLGGYEDSYSEAASPVPVDSDAAGTEPRAVLVAQPGGGSPDGTGNRTSLTRAGRRLK